MAPSSNLRRAQGGLTLIELMISLAIGLLVLLALLAVYLGSRAAYRSSDSLARVQETGRFAVEFIAQDARMSGFMGCRSRNLSDADQTLINITSPAVTFTGSRDGIRGFDGSSSTNIALWTNPTIITRAGASDVITLRRASGQMVGIASNSDPVARTVTLRHNAIGLGNGDLAVLGNCERALVFYVTNSPALTGIGNFPTVLEYQATGGGVGGVLGNDTSIPVPVFNIGSRAEVMRVAETSYFIGQNAAGRPSLFRASGGAVEELVDNVEDMDVLYGVDTTLPDQDGVIDVYRRADQIAAADWGRVVSARISLLVVGPEDNVTTGAQSYAFREASGDGVADTQTATDRRLRHVFTTTISLRNRVL
ncbi:MAG: PilW family protein [Burkholderiales bacterium]|jgi:type IV pilus assembly protein PilW|nr:PilW family protein [Burkholderiales bacterium]